MARLDKTMTVESSTLALEDQAQLTGVRDGSLLLVADGIGGAAAGDQASRLATETVVGFTLSLLPWFFSLEDDDDELQHLMESAIRRCQKAVANSPRTGPGSGTTLTIVYVVFPCAYVVHVGDSRAYLFRSGELQQLTTDQTVAQRLVDSGAMESSEVRGSRMAHMLWSAIGGEQPPTVEVRRVGLESGDVLLACTDGLTRHVSDDRIGRLLQTSPTLADACESLVAEANQEGGTDNITVAVGRFGPIAAENVAPTPE